MFGNEFTYELHEKEDGKSKCLRKNKEGDYQYAKRVDCDSHKAKFIPYRQFIVYPPEREKKIEYCVETIQGRANVALEKVSMKKCKDFQKEYPNLKHHIQQKD